MPEIYKARWGLVLPLLLLLCTGLVGLLAWTGAITARAAVPDAAPSAPLADGTELLPSGVTIETVLSNMNYPVAMAFDPAGRLFYVEKGQGTNVGAVRLYHPMTNTLQTAPVLSLSVEANFERGLLGIALDPDFNTNHYIYIYYTALGASENRVARFVENNGVGSGLTTIFNSVQTAGNHNGGNIHFGPDGKLYISIGDNANAANSQNVTVKNGKMHRINPDGTIPGDNPVFTQTGALASLYVMGLRNTYDFSFDPLTPGRIFASENGPNCDDEMNRLEAGYNYGWRASYPCDDASPSVTFNTIPPLWYMGSGGGAGGACCQAPTGIEVYDGSQIPEWYGHIFMATYNDSSMRHFYPNPARTGVTATNRILGITVNMDIETGPDGALWYMQGGGYTIGTLKRIVRVATPGPTNTPTVTRTPTPIVPTNTPTNTPTPTPYMVGHVVWEGRPAQPNSLQAMPVTLTLQSGSGPYYDYSGTTDASGYFTVSLGAVPMGAYDWRVKGPQFLATVGSTSISGVANSAEMGLQKTGDIVNDNCVEIADFEALRNSFGEILGGPNYDPRADLSGNHVVDIQDFNLFVTNFGVCGPAPLSPGG